MIREQVVEFWLSFNRILAHPHFLNRQERKGREELKFFFTIFALFAVSELKHTERFGRASPRHARTAPAKEVDLTEFFIETSQVLKTCEV